MGIADDSAEGVFVCFDGVMTKLHNLKAHEAGHMLARAGVNPEDTQVPPLFWTWKERRSPFKSGLVHTISRQIIRPSPSHTFSTCTAP